MTTTTGMATAVTRGAHAGEPADEDLCPAAAGDGRAHASTKVLRRGAESRRSALAAGPTVTGTRSLVVSVRRARVKPRSVEEHEPRKRYKQNPPRQPRQSSGPAVCSPSGATNATRAGGHIAMTTPANRSQNLNRRRRGGPARAGSSWKRGNAAPREKSLGWPQPKAPSPPPSWRKATTHATPPRACLGVILGGAEVKQPCSARHTTARAPDPPLCSNAHLIADVARPAPRGSATLIRPYRRGKLAEPARARFPRSAGARRRR